MRRADATEFLWLTFENSMLKLLCDIKVNIFMAVLRLRLGKYIVSIPIQMY